MDLASEKYNVFIFDFNGNNQEDVNLLKTTFEDQNCIVVVYDRLNYADFKAKAEIIRRQCFDVFNYIVIAVLDERNSFHHLVRTSDNHEAYIHDELLDYIQENESLRLKKRLFLIQTNQNVNDDYPYLVHDRSSNILWAGPTFYMYGAARDERLVGRGFIKAFCEEFRRNARTKCITEIFENVELGEDDGAYMEGPAQNRMRGEMCVFGKALEDNELRDCFYHVWLQRRRN